MSAKKQESITDFITNFLMGGVSAAVSKTVAAPIERVKLNIQNQSEMLKSGALDRPYNGIFDCFRRVATEEGVGALWRGNMANVIRYFPTQALNFALKDYFKTLFRVPKEKGKMMAFGSNILSGGCAGSVGLLFVYSLDYARTRLANDNKSAKKGGQRQFNGLVDVYRKTLATDGLAGLYRGFVISCVGIFIYRGLYFGLFDTVMPMVNENLPKNAQGDIDPWVRAFSAFALGFVVTNTAGFASYPVDTIRRRMMMTSGQAEKYNSSIDAAVKILRTEGIRAYFSGAGANILRAVAGAGALAGYDALQVALLGKKYGDGSG